MMMMTFNEIIRVGDIVILIHTIAELLLQEQGTGDKGGGGAALFVPSY